MQGQADLHRQNKSQGLLPPVEGHMGNPGVGWAFVAGLDFSLNTGGKIPKEFPDRCRVKLTCTGGTIPKEGLAMRERACW